MLALPLLLGFCAPDETISGYVPEGSRWALEKLDGTPAPAALTLAFPDEGRVTGAGPCNGFTAAQLHPYPWFGIADLAATKRGCPDLAVEARLFAALQGMTLAEVQGELLLLTGPEGRAMLFRQE